MLKPKKIKVTPYLSGSGSKYTYDLNYGVSMSRGPVSLDISTSTGSSYRPETDITLGINIPITKRVKDKRKFL
jgi:hypothetical protein